LVTYNPTNIQVTLAMVPVPEPGTVLGVAATAMGLVGWICRRRAAKD
jgi:hypothetical protein